LALEHVLALELEFLRDELAWTPFNRYSSGANYSTLLFILTFELLTSWALELGLSLTLFSPGLSCTQFLVASRNYALRKVRKGNTCFQNFLFIFYPLPPVKS
jgi:hypothetical protein